MAVLNRVLLYSQERVDLADLLSIDSYTIGDFKYFIQALIGDTTPYVLTGFDVADPADSIGSQSISINVANSVVFYPESPSGPFFFGLPTGNVLSAPLVPELRPNATNYVYLTLANLDTSPDTRAFWDPDANGGTGEEFTQSVDTAAVLEATINVSVSSFPDNTVPIAIVVMGPTSIVSIEDARNLLFRLGTGGVDPNPFNTYNFPDLPSAEYARLETPGTITSSSQPDPFQGGDKNISTLKEWMDVVMTKLLELGGTTYWYEGTGGGVGPNIPQLFNDALATTLKSKGQWQYAAVTPNLLTWTDDIVIERVDVPVEIFLRAGDVTINNYQLLWLDLVRDQPINSLAQAVNWINGSAYVNGIIGAFGNLAQGDWIKQLTDSDARYLRVEEFFAGTNGSGGTTTAALAQSVLLSGSYAGASATQYGIYIQGSYTSSDAIVSTRGDIAIENAGGNMFWLALRSDTINEIGNISTVTLTGGTISDADGTTANLEFTAHGLSDGDPLTISTGAYAGAYQVQVVDANNLTIQTTVLGGQSGVTAYYGICVTVERTNGYGYELESADHGFQPGETIIIAGTTNYNGSYIINVRPPVLGSTQFIFPIGSAVATETSGTATLPTILVRNDSGLDKLVLGESIDIGSDIANLNTWLGRNSITELHPIYTLPNPYNVLDGQENYFSSPNDSAMTRMTELTAMMADKAQDKTIGKIAENIYSVTLGTSGSNQTVVFNTLSTTPVLYIAQPSSPVNSQVTLTGTLNLPVNSAAYFSIDRNNGATISGLGSLTVTTIASLPVDENIFIFAYRLSDTTVWLWNGRALTEALTFWDDGKVAELDLVEDRSMMLRSSGTLTWDGTQTLTFTSNVEIEVSNPIAGGTPADHTVAVSNSPMTIPAGYLAYVTINRYNPGETVVPTIATTVPAQTNANKDTVILFYSVAQNGENYLFIPVNKQFIGPGQTISLGQSPAASGNGSGIGDDIDSLNYNASFRDTFSSIPTSTGSVNISTGYTQSSLYSPSNDYYRLSYDASYTVTGTGTAMTLSGTPYYTVAVGDTLVVGSQARRITALSSQTSYTIEAAYTTNPVAAAATVSQTVYTVDINNYNGSSTDGYSIGSVYTENVAQVLLDYNDNNTLNSNVPAEGVTPNVAYTASSDGTNYSNATVRPTNIDNTIDATLSLPTSSTSLYLRFFANKTSGTGAVNLLNYRAFFHPTTTQAFGYNTTQAYCFTNDVGTAYGCSAPTVVGGKTQLALNWTYTPGINGGYPNGQIEVFVNGQKIPRYLDATTTPDAYYTEVNSNTIQLDSNYSTYNYSLEVIKYVAIQDLSPQNSLRINNLYDQIVGTSTQVTAGQATTTSLTAALAAIPSAGGRILILNYTSTENVTVAQNVYIEGRGYQSIISGTVTFASGSSYSVMKNLQITGNVFFNSGTTAIFFTENWLGVGATVTDNGTGNYKLYTVG